MFPLKFRKMFANALMLPQFYYLDIIWSKTHKNKLRHLDILYKKVAKIALNVDVRERSIEVYKNMGWLPLHLRRQLHLGAYMYRIINDYLDGAEWCPRTSVQTLASAMDVGNPSNMERLRFVGGESKDLAKKVRSFCSTRPAGRRSPGGPPQRPIFLRLSSPSWP